MKNFTVTNLTITKMQHTLSIPENQLISLLKNMWTCNWEWPSASPWHGITIRYVRVCFEVRHCVWKMMPGLILRGEAQCTAHLIILLWAVLSFLFFTESVLYNHQLHKWRAVGAAFISETCCWGPAIMRADRNSWRKWPRCSDLIDFI